MRNKNKNNWKFLQREEGDFEEAARQGHKYSNKCHNVEDFKKTYSGRNPENYSIWRDRDNRSYQHNLRHAYSDAPEKTDCGFPEPFTQVLQVRTSKTKKCMKCPPVVASCKFPRSYWEDKPMLVMKIIKRIRCRQSKDSPPNGSSLSSSSTEKEIPADSGLVSEDDWFQDRRQPEDGKTNAAKEKETPKSWAGLINLREEDSSGTSETNQSEKEENNICGTNVQLLPTAQKEADEQEREKDTEAHGDSGTCDQPEDKNRKAIIKDRISETERYNQAEFTKRIHQLGEEMNTLKVRNQSLESRVQQLMEDKQLLSKDYDSSKDKGPQLMEANSNMASYKTCVIQMEDKKTQSSVPQHKENIREREEETQLHQLQQEKRRKEDIGGQDQKWKEWFSLFFSKASKTGKETKAETNMTGEAVEKKRRKWFPWIFFSKAFKREKEAKAEETNTAGEAVQKNRRNCFINMFQRTYLSMKKKTCVTF